MDPNIATCQDVHLSVVVLVHQHVVFCADSTGGIQIDQLAGNVHYIGLCAVTYIAVEVQLDDAGSFLYANGIYSNRTGSIADKDITLCVGTQYTTVRQCDQQFCGFCTHRTGCRVQINIVRSNDRLICHCHHRTVLCLQHNVCTRYNAVELQIIVNLIHIDAFHCVDRYIAANDGFYQIVRCANGLCVHIQPVRNHNILQVLAVAQTVDTILLLFSI